MDIKFSKTVKHFKKESIWLNIDLYWKLALGIIFVTIVTSSIFGFRSFMKINGEITPAVDNGGEQNEKLMKDKLDSVLLIFSDRQAESSKIINNPAPVVDPSL